ncbi:MAG: ATP-binding protein [Acidobacteriota bacterium]
MTPGRRRRASPRLKSALDRVLLHDIKNVGFRLQMLRSNLEEHYADPHFQRSLRELLTSTIDRLGGIVERFGGEDTAVLIKVELDLNGIIRAIAGGATRRGARFTPEESSRLAVLSLSLGAIPAVWGDPYFLRDALESLIENALEAAGPSGRVLVRSFASGSGARSRAVVEVIDNGGGMSAEFVRERLFRPFQTTKADGVGLGVFTASQIVRHHGGTIRVKSERGSGTVVRLSFASTRAAS